MVIDNDNDIIDIENLYVINKSNKKTLKNHTSKNIPNKKIKLLRYKKEPPISPDNHYFKITKALPFNDENDDFLL